jgi:CheY-like chemotaxis protein
VEEALARLAAQAYDVLLSDLNMPGRGGLELIAEARRDHPATRVVVLYMVIADELFGRRSSWGLRPIT